MSHVFTYGSLMFPRVWSRVVGGTYAAAAASLAGFHRQRVRDQDYPSLAALAEGSPHGVVDGVLYLNVGAADLAALDAFEGDDYRRIQVPVTLREAIDGEAQGSLLLADTYLYVAADKVEPGPWDPQAFERERIESFLRSHAPPRAD